MEKRRAITIRGLHVIVAVTLWGLCWTSFSFAQTSTPVTHEIFMTAMEVKGATLADKLGPPSVNPKDLSKGYGFKAPGQVDKSNPHKWQVASYMFSPSFVTMRQGDTVKLTVFVVNGDKHEVWVSGPDGKRIVAPRTWNRGREYKIQFVATEAGTYQLVCSEHAPSMIATFSVLSR